MASNSEDAPSLIGVDTTSPSKTTPRQPSQRKSGKRVSELQKRFVSSSETKTVDSEKVVAPMTRSATMQKVYEHEVRVWLEKQVVASRDF